MTTPPPELTPTEQLLGELLAARYRLGEPFWPIKSSATTRRAANRLEKYGYVDLMHGQTERHFRAALTQAGIDRFTTRGYVSPALKNHNN